MWTFRCLNCVDIQVFELRGHSGVWLVRCVNCVDVRCVNWLDV